MQHSPGEIPLCHSKNVVTVDVDIADDFAGEVTEENSFSLEIQGQDIELVAALCRLDRNLVPVKGALQGSCILEDKKLGAGLVKRV